MNEYVHPLDMKRVLHNHARSMSDSLERLLPSDVEYTRRCIGGRVGDSDDWIVSLNTYRRKNEPSAPVLSVEYDTRKPREIKVSSVLDSEIIRGTLDNARL